MGEQPDVRRVRAVVIDNLQAVIDKLAPLALLQGVPFAYLVPNGDASLPAESLKLFHIDRDWQLALVLGAVAAGANRADRIYALNETQAAVLKELRDRGALPELEDPPFAGMLLRSRLVRDYPKLNVEASSDGTSLPALRFERLSDNILLVIWKQAPQIIELDEPEDGVRFWWDPRSNAPAAPATERGAGFALRHLSPATLRIGGDPQ